MDARTLRCFTGVCIALRKPCATMSIILQKILKRSASPSSVGVTAGVPAVPPNPTRPLTLVP